MLIGAKKKKTTRDGYRSHFTNAYRHSCKLRLSPVSKQNQPNKQTNVVSAEDLFVYDETVYLFAQIVECE